MDKVKVNSIMKSPSQLLFVVAALVGTSQSICYLDIYNDVIMMFKINIVIIYSGCALCIIS